jgi:ATP-dependent phosphofructokinase / diphosphate-dependent phosphofructokinase
MVIGSFEKSLGHIVDLGNGAYTDLPLSTISSVEKTVDAKELYDVNEYRPKVRHVGGKPISLYQVSYHFGFFIA